MCFTGHMKSAVAVCSSIVSLLCGLLRHGKVPICMIRLVFVLKVESKLRFARWLWAAEPGALVLLTDVYKSWALQLMDADPWRCAEICVSELGWQLDGGARAVKDIALKRAYFWYQADSSLAGHAFVRGHLSPGDTWAKRSLGILRGCGILDWPEWLCNSDCRSYNTYVHACLADSCFQAAQTALSKHTRPICYSALASEPTTMFHDALRMKLGWSTLVGHWSLSRLRCGLIRLGHSHGKPSSASVQESIFCSRRYSSVT